MISSIQSFSQITYTRDQREYIASKIIEGNACIDREVVKDSVIKNLNVIISNYDIKDSLQKKVISIKDTLITERDSYIQYLNEETKKLQKNYQKKILKHKIINVAVIIVSISAIIALF
jgi:hypothetical protein